MSYTWDGRDDADRVVAEGVYRPRVRLRAARAHDRAPEPDPRRHDGADDPLVRVVPAGLLARRRRPSRPRHRDLRVDEPRAGDDARRRCDDAFSSSSAAREGRLVWFGMVDGRPCGPGRTSSGCARSTARATGRRRTRAVAVRVRYVELARDRVEVGARDALRDPRLDRRGVVSLALRRARGHGAAQRGSSCARPRTPGTYVLYVVSRGRSADRAEVVVLGARRSSDRRRRSSSSASAARGRPCSA